MYLLGVLLCLAHSRMRALPTTELPFREETSGDREECLGPGCGFFEEERSGTGGHSDVGEDVGLLLETEFRDSEWTTDAAAQISGNWVAANDSSAYSCAGVCGYARSGICSCAVSCVVYRDCCSDIHTYCPGVTAESELVIRPELLGASFVCANTTGRLVVDKCPVDQRNQSDDDMHGWTEGGYIATTAATEDVEENLDILDYIRSITYVYDTHTMVLYKNYGIYLCYASPQSKPVLWGVVVEVFPHFVARWDREEDLEELLRLSHAVALEPPSPSSAGKACDSQHIASFDLALSMSLNMDTFELDFRVVGKESFRNMVWTELSCELKDTLKCSHVACARGGTVVNNVCHQRLYYRIVIKQPPDALCLPSLMAISWFLQCALRNFETGVVSVEILDVGVNDDSFTDPKYVINYHLIKPGDEFFRLDFVLDVTESLGLESVMLEVLASYFLMNSMAEYIPDESRTLVYKGSPQPDTFTSEAVTTEDPGSLAEPLQLKNNPRENIIIGLLLHKDEPFPWNDDSYPTGHFSVLTFTTKSFRSCHHLEVNSSGVPWVNFGAIPVRVLSGLLIVWAWMW